MERKKIVEFCVEGLVVGGLWLVDGEIMGEGYLPNAEEACTVDFGYNKEKENKNELRIP